jgi:hypothetical protein
MQKAEGKRKERSFYREDKDTKWSGKQLKWTLFYLVPCQIQFSSWNRFPNLICKPSVTSVALKAPSSFSGPEEKANQTQPYLKEIYSFYLPLNPFYYNFRTFVIISSTSVGRTLKAYLALTEAIAEGRTVNQRICWSDLVGEFLEKIWICFDARGLNVKVTFGLGLRNECLLVNYWIYILSFCS